MSFNTVEPMRYWCQKVIPLVYDDSLSYYEVLCKTTQKLNELIETNNSLPEYIANLIREFLNGDKIKEVLTEVISDFILNVKYPPAGLTPAKGDGTQDDTAALQGCIDYAFNNGGMCVYIPNGNYLTESLVLKSGVSLVGASAVNSRLVLKGGASNALLSGATNNNIISNLSFDGNAAIQINNVDCVSLVGSNFTFNNVYFNDGTNLLNITANGGNSLITNCNFKAATEKHLVLNGTERFSGVCNTFGSLSKIYAVCNIDAAVNNAYFSGLNFTEETPLIFNVTGANNTFEYYAANAVKEFNAGADSANTFLSRGKAERKILSGAYTLDAETIGLTGETINLSAQDIVLNPVSPVQYVTPTVINDYFKSVPFKDETGIYDVLVAGDMEELEKKLKDQFWINVVENGVDNTGVIECSTIINQLLLEGKPLYFPAGTYSIGDYIRLKNNSIMLGENAELVGTGTSKWCFFADGTSNTVVSGFTLKNFRRGFDYRGGGEYHKILNCVVREMYRNTVNGDDAYLIFLYNVNHILIDGCQLYGDTLNSDCIHITGNCTNITINNIKGYSGDNFIDINPDGVTTETTNIVEDIFINNMEQQSSTFCGIRFYVFNPNSRIGRVTVQNSVMYGDSVSCVRMIHSISGTHDPNLGNGLITDVYFNNCTFGLGANATENQQPLYINSENVQKLTIDNCRFLFNSNIVETNQFIKIMYGTITSFIMNNCRFDNNKSVLLNVIKSDANTTITNLVVSGNYFSGRVVGGAKADMLVFNGAVTYGNIYGNTFINGKAIVSTDSICGLNISGNNGTCDNVVLVTGAANTTRVVADGNKVTGSIDAIIAGTQATLNGVITCSDTPAIKNGDFYIYKSGSIYNVRICSEGVWKSPTLA